MFRFSQRSIDSLKGVHPAISIVMGAAIQDSPVDFTIVEGVRTTQRQQQLFAQGRTTPGSIVTNADGVRTLSNHQAKADGLGYAIDLYPFVNGSVQVNDTANLRRVAAHILQKAQQLRINIEWGGNWTSIVDLPHFELK